MFVIIFQIIRNIGEDRWAYYVIIMLNFHSSLFAMEKEV